MFSSQSTLAPKRLVGSRAGHLRNWLFTLSSRAQGRALAAIDSTQVELFVPRITADKLAGPQTDIDRHGSRLAAV